MYSKLIYTVISESKSLEESAGLLSEKLVISGESTPAELVKDAKFYLKEIKDFYRKTLSEKSLSFTDKQNWIIDNYYLVEKELKFSCLTINNEKALPNAVYAGAFKATAVYIFCCLLCEISKNLLSSEVIIRYLKGSQHCRSFQLRELLAFFHVIKFVLAENICDEINNQQVLDATKIGNCIKSLKFLSTLNSEEIISSVYAPEIIISNSNDKIYSELTCETKNLYREKLESYAKKQDITEEEAIKQLLSTAEKENAHFGCLLFGTHRDFSTKYYGLLWVVSFALSVLTSLLIKNLWFLVIFVFIYYEIIKQIADFVISKKVKTRHIPALELKGGIPDNGVTTIVVSMLLTGKGSVEFIKERALELYSTNYEKNINICFLADLTDSKTAINSDDEKIIKSFTKTIELLNETYANCFFGFIRKRKYNKSQNKYMGWERKRGAIVELVRFIKGGKTGFAQVSGNIPEIKKSKYILALDSDTFVPIENVRKLCGMMMHPANRPHYSIEKGIVTRGYGLITTKIITGLESAGKSSFSRIFAGLGGTEVYNDPSFEINQILSGQGIFTGKGIFDIDVFYNLLDKRFPENTVLSHDLLEGAILRTAYAGEVSFIDNFPQGVLSYFKRLHRWIRGDIQSAIFLGSFVKDGNGKIIKNNMGKSFKFKIYENIRRAVTPIFLAEMLIKSIFFPGTELMAICFVALALGMGELINIAAILYYNGSSAMKIRYNDKSRGNVYRLIKLVAVRYMLLAYSAFISAEAIISSLWRMFISKKNLLTWVTAEQTDNKYRGTIGEYIPQMISSIIIGVILLAGNSIFTIVTGAVFIASPFISCYLSKPRKKLKQKISEKNKEKLIVHFRDMWQYFADFLNESNNFLPPDNYQESPLGIAAQRTSPTNIGLTMLCVLSAADLKIISVRDMLFYLTKMTDTIERAEKYAGHLYNWYDISTMKVLQPRYISAVDSGNFVASLITLIEGLREHADEHEDAATLIKRLQFIINGTDFDIVYDYNKDLLKIGMEPDNPKDNENCYDLLMSESRITSYYLAATRQVPTKHFKVLGRLMASNGGFFGLKSWTGTMFEYFMPFIFMNSFEGSLIDESLKFAVSAQKARAAETKTPYGISESGFYCFDSALNYQYKAFGVSKLGLKRGLDTELVISPYSTYLTLPFDFSSSILNLDKLEKLGAYGKYGFYEALDFTKTRTVGEYAVVKSFMAHHVGMSMLSVNNAINDFIIQKRFMKNIAMNSATYLLCEKLPETVIPYNTTDRLQIPDTTANRLQNSTIENRYLSVLSPKGNIVGGEISETVLDNGCGFISEYGTNLTKYRKDYIGDPKGVFAFLKVEGKEPSSLTFAPFYDSKIKYKTVFSDNKAAFYSKGNGYTSKITLVADNGYLRRSIRIKNTSEKTRTMSLLVYFEPTLTDHSSEISHPEFSNLFIESEILTQSNLMIFRRRPRKKDGKSIYFAISADGDFTSFHGENRREMVVNRSVDEFSLKNFGQNHFGNDGVQSVTPCCAIKLDFTIKSQSEKNFTLNFITGSSKDNIIGAINRCRSSSSEAVAPNNDLDEMLQLQANILPKLYYSANTRHSFVLYGDTAFGLKRLWRYGISGDMPYIFIFVKGEAGAENVLVFLRLFATLKKKHQNCELVIGYSEGGEYDRPLYSAIRDCVTKCGAEYLVDKRNGIFIVNIQDEGDKEFVKVAASYYSEAPGSVVDDSMDSRFLPTQVISVAKKFTLPETDERYFETSVGAFTNDGYVFTDKNALDNRPPWCHILSNRVFGTMVSDSSLGFTFARNSRENRITDWSNDIIRDNRGEKLYARIDGEIFDIIAGSNVKFTAYSAEYFGTFNNIDIAVTVFIPLKVSSKIILIKAQNSGNQTKRVEVCYYVDPILSNDYEKNKKFVTVTHYMGGLLMKNYINSDFPKGSAYLDITGENTFYTNDKSAFLQGIWDSKKADEHQLGICGVKGSAFILNPGQKNKIVASLTFSQSTEDINLIKSITENPKTVSEELEKRKDHQQFDGNIYINTGDDALNILYNTLLPVQIENSRINSRTAFYQNGGAYGFRDQLQDAICISTVKPELLKYQILRCCAHQFEEGDVLHWWHEIGEDGIRSKGVRTRCSDDMLWLPYALAEYTEKCGNDGLTSCNVYYITGDRLSTGINEKYITAQRSHLKESVYHHALKAIRYSINKGEKGLLLFSGGDWNDGMNLVGIEGRGESVWLSMFAVNVFRKFAVLSEAVGDTETVNFLHREIESLLSALEKHSWDGKWFLRGFYDSGAPLGSQNSDECKIDILPQSFASIIDFPDKTKVKTALESAKEMLADKENGIIKLFTPAFNKTGENPGYIMGYIPGVRENGGQYTHAAVWLAMGFIRNKDFDTGYELLSMINPINHSRTDNEIKKYRLEPYYLAGDVYNCKDNAGRGGWSIYTGAAGWYYKCVTEELLGIYRRPERIEFKPSIPSSWASFEIKLYINNTDITVSYEKDDTADEEIKSVPLDGKTHKITIKFS